jgi:3-oxoacyl-[acyl-carrier protein] reductase
MKVALITGASRGLGAAMAKGLAAAGWDVAVNYAHDTSGADRVVAAIHAAGGRAMSARFDVTDDEAIHHGLARITAMLGPVDLIVNNATGPQPVIKIEHQTWEHHLEQLRFFVKAPLSLLQTVLPDWRTRRTGRVINIGSDAFEIGNPEFGHYVAAKGAMLGLTRSWARELGSEGITVNLVEPGWIPVERHASVDPALLEEYRRNTALAKLGTPDDLIGVVIFLASPQANFITGQAFAVNGGRTLS